MGRETSWASAPSDMEDPNVKQLAVKYSKTPAQILLRYLMERNIAIIPKSVTPSRIVENFEKHKEKQLTFSFLEYGVADSLLRLPQQ
ncbi:hypothetical protein TELCIR_23830 [Teladorsagia circumcincta]|uniref:NADP-dependent oxidoreductase domain-containing protein n=1 Tax=Teladorsagia circumcincta TaxID=45464 RepID=A0A2G9T9Z2_TELCI|nr:hypothetical protein TELCIR_23830 [Teladorsagia circumcincta]